MNRTPRRRPFGRFECGCGARLDKIASGGYETPWSIYRCKAGHHWSLEAGTWKRIGQSVKVKA